MKRIRVTWKGVGKALLVWFLLDLVIGAVLSGFPFPGIGTAHVVQGVYNGWQRLKPAFPTPGRLYRRARVASLHPDAAVVTAGNELGWKTLKSLVAERPVQNVFFSPYCLNAGLSLTANGAASETQAEMLKSMGLAGTALETANDTQLALGSMLNYADSKVKVATGSAMWGRPSITFQPGFVALAGRDYDAPVRAIDPASAAGQREMDAWVRRATDGKIRGAGPMDQRTTAVLMGALYFRGEWSSRFRKEDTRPDEFTLDDGSEVEVETMFGTAEGGAWREKDYVLGRLPYCDGSMAMYVLVPGRPWDRSEERLRLGDLLARTDWAALEKGIDRIRPDHTTVSLPKFKEECDVSLKPVLQSFGMKRAFTGGKADLSAMGADVNGPLYLSDVRQRSVVEVNEEGTVAATINIIPSFTAGEHVNRVSVDRPFVWLIRDERSKAVLFLGAMYDPRRGSE